MSDFKTAFLQDLKEFHRAPFLFIGSGLSRRYINAEDWEALLRRFSEMIDVKFNQIKAGADGDLPAAASALADVFFDKWWTENKFLDHRNKYENSNLKRESCLKIEIAEYLQIISKNDNDDAVLQEEIALLSNAVVDGIITTNYDLFLERVFADFKPYIGQRDLLFSDPQGIGEIYKIHGCCSKPDSLVLTAADYKDFNHRNPYLAAKLLTIFTEHPILILGYSLNDPNVQAILESISSCLDEEGLKKLSNRLIMVQWKRDSTTTTISSGHTFSFHGRTIPYRKIECPNFIELFQVLGSLKRKLSPKLLRHLKDRVYDLVKTSSPTTTVFVRDIDDDSDLSEAEVVIGIGAISTFSKGIEAEAAEIAKRGYKTYNQTELLDEYVKEEKISLNPEHCQKLVQGTLPTILKGATHLPIFRFLKIGGYLDENGALLDIAIDEKVSDSFVSLTALINKPKLTYISKLEKASLPKNKSQFNTWINSTLPTKVVNGILHINKSAIDLDPLHMFISKNQNLLYHTSSIHKTNYIKCVCLYDYLKYGTPTPKSL
jgi:hypothetical protein